MHCDDTDSARLPIYREQLSKVLDKLASIVFAPDILFVSHPVDVRESRVRSQRPGRGPLRPRHAAAARPPGRALR